MAEHFIFRCPNTGLKVQGLDTGQPSVMTDGDRHIAVECPACDRFHFVDPRTGRLLTERGR